MKEMPIRNKQGQIVGTIKVYWSETLKKYVTIPED